jgi:hypothetical protein
MAPSAETITSSIRDEEKKLKLGLSSNWVSGMIGPLAVACFVMPVTSAAAFDANTAAEPGVKTASRGLGREVDKAISGLPLLVSKADVEAPLTRVRQIESDDSPSSASRPEDPAFKAVVLTPPESTDRPVQPNPGGPVIDSEKTLQKPEYGSAAPAVKPKPPAVSPDVRSSASTSPQSAQGAKTAASAPPRSFGPSDIAGTRALTRF